MGTEGENCPALIRFEKERGGVKKKKTRTEDHFSAARERSKAPLAEQRRREGRCYRRALISFTDECEMASSVVRTRARRYDRVLYPDLLFFSPNS